MLRLYNSLNQEYFRSAALTQLNRQGLTPQKLQTMVQEGRVSHRISQLLGFLTSKPEKLQSPQPLDRRIARQIVRLYNRKLASDQRVSFDKELKSKKLSLQALEKLGRGS